MILLAVFLFIISTVAIVYHHLIYPRLLNYFSDRRLPVKPGQSGQLYNFVFIIPMHNEADFIADKIANLALINYPSDQYKVILLDDGSTDDTLRLARAAAKKYPKLQLKIKTFSVNRGKVALYNEVIPSVSDDCILFFSDVSSSLTENVLQRVNAWFNNPQVGVVGTRYQYKQDALVGEKVYWDYLVKIKMDEARLGSAIGYHGTGYAMRKSLWHALPKNTINDDLVIPLKGIEQGFVGVYDVELPSTEQEVSSHSLDWNRRIRISRGNVQQIGYLFSLLSPRHGFVAWMFFSSKVLRTTMPWFLLLMFISSVILATHYPVLFLPVVLGQCLFYLLGILNLFFKAESLDVITYFIKGHAASMFGWFTLFMGHGKRPWQRAKIARKKNFIHPVVVVGKWLMDKVGALIGIVVLIVLYPIIAIQIKRSSPGPVFFKQIRVGRGNEKHTRFFYLYKFRTMHLNSEKNHSKWTKKNDPRVFDFGRFLRKTHLDELPQFYNILKGDMSIVGPRPELPSIYPYLEENIPFYEERLFGVLPGLTGASQVTYGYDKRLNDVRRKVALDHAYAVYLTNPWVWFKTDMAVLIKTVKVVFLRRGH